MACINSSVCRVKYRYFNFLSTLHKQFVFCRISTCCTTNVNRRNYLAAALYDNVIAESNLALRLTNSLLRFHEFNLSCRRCLHHYSDQKEIAHVSVSHVKKILTSMKIEISDGYTCCVIKCPLCNNPKKNELYINKVTGFVICLGCKRSGSWQELENFLLKRNKKEASEDHLLKKYNDEAGTKWKELCKTLLPFTSLGATDKQLLCNKLSLKEVPHNLFEQLSLHVDKDLSSIYIPLRYASGSEIVGYKIIKLNRESNVTSDRVLSESVLRNEDGTTEPCHNCRGILLHKSKNVKKDQAVLVHNLIDFISLAQLNLNYHIICLPHGLTNLPQEVLPILEKYKKIVLWFGNDASCWDSARQFAKKLCDSRCYFVRPVEQNPPARVIAIRDDGIIEVKRVIQSAEPIRHSAIINFSSIRQDVLSELQNIDKVQGVKWQRFPGLNNLLKGFRRGELTIFTGPTGSGKTTFLSEYSLDLLMQGVATLWGSFEVRNQRLARTMLQQYVQLPLDLYPDKLNYWADSFERLPLHFMTFHGQQPLKVVLEAVEHAAYVYDISHVIIDNVQFMLGMLDTETNLDRFYRQDALIASFRNFATAYNCHVTLVIHPRKEKDAELLTINSVFGGAKASQEADNVFIIQQKMLQSLKIKKYLQVAKNRFTGDLGLIPLDFDKETLSFSTKIDKKQQKKSDVSNIEKDDDGLTKDVPVIEDLHILQ